MIHKCNILTSSVLRGFQVLFAIVVLGLSVTLVKNHNDHGNQEGYSAVSTILPLATGIGALSLVAAFLSLAIAWTNFLREHIEMLVDVVIVLINIVGGTIIAIKLQGAKCADSSEKNRVGDGYPYKGALAGIDLLNGGCVKSSDGQSYCYNAAYDSRYGRLNVRCMQSQADSVFMFLTVVVLFGTITLTFLRLKSDRRY